MISLFLKKCFFVALSWKCDFLNLRYRLPPLIISLLKAYIFYLNPKKIMFQTISNLIFQMLGWYLCFLKSIFWSSIMKMRFFEIFGIGCHHWYYLCSKHIFSFKLKETWVSYHIDFVFGDVLINFLKKVNFFCLMMKNLIF